MQETFAAHDEEHRTTSPYLKGGGEMGHLIRSFDWTGTRLGTPDTWPQNLLVTLSIIINSQNPMLLWWGPELMQFYNDAFRPSLGFSGKHPQALGQRAEECWPETWDVISPLIDHVMSDKGAIWREDQLIPIFRNNKLENVYWTFGYSKISDENGKSAGVLVTCIETTEQVITRSKLIESYKNERVLNSQLSESNQRLSTVNEALKLNISRLADSQQTLHHYIARLEDSESRFRQLMLRAPVAIAIISAPELIIEMANDKMLQYLGRSGDDVLSHPFFIAFPEMAGQGLKKLLQNVVDTGDPLVVSERPVILKRNRRMVTTWINLMCEPVRRVDGTIDKMLVVLSEVTEQVNARNEIALEEEKLRQAVDSASLSTWFFNFKTRDFIPSPGLRTLFDFRQDDEMSVSQVFSVISPAYRDKVFASIDEALFGGHPFNMEFPIEGYHDRKIRWLRATGKLYPSEGSEPMHFSGTVSDITEQNEFHLRKYEILKEELREHQKQEIFHVTITTQEEERKRIAESLHNGIGQLLYAVKLNLSQIDSMQSDGDFKKAKQITEELLNEAIRESRRISHELTPQFLEDFGLQEAILDVCKHFKHFLPIRCQFKGSRARLDKYLELSVYRIIQELVLNIVKHAQASETSVEVNQEAENITLVISDNGNGFNPAQVRGKGIGLQGIINKVKLLNGRCTIKSDNGTTVTIVIPKDRFFRK